MAENLEFFGDFSCKVSIFIWKPRNFIQESFIEGQPKFPRSLVIIKGDFIIYGLLAENLEAQFEWLNRVI